MRIKDESGIKPDSHMRMSHENMIHFRKGAAGKLSKKS